MGVLLRVAGLFSERLPDPEGIFVLIGRAGPGNGAWGRAFPTA